MLNVTEPEPFVLVTDASWTGADGPFRASSEQFPFRTLYDGSEFFSATAQQQEGWNAPGFSAQWAPAVLQDPVGDGRLGDLTPSTMPAIIAQPQPLLPVSVTQPGPGVFVVDFGMNVAGFALLQAPASGSPADIFVLHAEMLDSRGYAQNQFAAPPYGPHSAGDCSHYGSCANQTDIYHLTGTETPGSWLTSPAFTYHGFRSVAEQPTL